MGGSSWLFGGEGLDLSLVEEDFAADSEGLESPPLNQSGNRLSRNAADAGGFRL
jgi:hypothetical protein